MKRESIIQKFSICAALIFVVLASGCIIIGPNAIGPTTWLYSGEPIRLQKSEVAVIKGWWMVHINGYGGIDIYKIDGMPVYATKVEVLPGWHELILRKYRFNLAYGAPDEYAKVAFDFEAGHEYKIKFFNDYIVDVTTGAKILGFSFSR